MAGHESAEPKKADEIRPDWTSIVRLKVSGVHRKNLEVWLRYACEIIDKQAEQIKAKDEAIAEIERVACGDDQVADDDSDGMGWIYRRIQALKGGDSNGTI
jgi:hypothetical protein